MSVTDLLPGWNISLDIACTALASQPLGFLVRGFEGLVLGLAVGCGLVWGLFLCGFVSFRVRGVFCSLIYVRLCALARSIQYFLTYNNNEKCNFLLQS